MTPCRTNHIGNNWQHNPAHRQGVRYSNASVQRRFGNNNQRAGSAGRMDLGERTAVIAKQMTSFDPDQGWMKVDTARPRE
jgi:Protein of unknown function (DUF2950)